MVDAVGFHLLMRGLRARLAVAFALVAALVAVVLGVVVYERSAQDRLDRARDEVAAQARASAVNYAETQNLLFRGAVNDPHAPAALRRAVRGHRVASYAALGGPDPEVWAAAPVPGSSDSVYVSASFAADAAALADLRRTLLLAGLAAA